MPTALDLGLQAHARLARTHVEEADALGGVELVAGGREQVDAERFHIERYLADGLGGVAVPQDAALAGQPPDRRQRLQDPDLVVGGHERDKGRPRRDGCRELAEVNLTVAVHGQISYLHPLLFQGVATL